MTLLFGQVAKNMSITIATNNNQNNPSPLSHKAPEETLERSLAHFEPNRRTPVSPSQLNTHTTFSSRSKKWSVPQPVTHRHSQHQQVPAFQDNTVTPIEKIKNVIEENFVRFVILEFADVFNLKMEFLVICLQFAAKEDTIEYQRRHAFAEQISLTKDAANVRRVQVFLYLLADTWVIDQGFYHSVPNTRKRYFPVCQIHFFGRMLSHSGMHKEDKGVSSTKTQNVHGPPTA